MRFTAAQYDHAIASLALAREQLSPDGRHCRICHDTGHQAWECGHNPLIAMAACEEIARQAIELHDRIHMIEDALNDSDQAGELADWREDVHTYLHYTAGFDHVLGSRLGPTAIVMPQRCGSLLQSVSSDPCEAIVDGMDGLCRGCREFKGLCAQHDEGAP